MWFLHKSDRYPNYKFINLKNDNIFHIIDRMKGFKATVVKSDIANFALMVTMELMNKVNLTRITTFTVKLMNPT